MMIEIMIGLILICAVSGGIMAVKMFRRNQKKTEDYVNLEDTGAIVQLDEQQLKAKQKEEKDAFFQKQTEGFESIAKDTPDVFEDFEQMEEQEDVFVINDPKLAKPKKKSTKKK